MRTIFGKDLKKHEIAVLLFAKYRHVSFTNNRAERDLRMQKLNKKSRAVVLGQVNMHTPIAVFQAICNPWLIKDITHLSRYKLFWRVVLMKYGASSYLFRYNYSF